MTIPANCSAFHLPRKTPRLVLRALRVEDLADIHLLCSHPEICRYIRPPMTREQVEKHIRDRLRPWSFEDGKWLSLAVCLAHDESRVIGEAVFRFESRADRRMEIGYRFRPESQGKGYAIEAVRGLVALLLENFELHKLVAYCDAENAASIRLLQRLGMTEEGLLREHYYLNGGWRDLHAFALLCRKYRST